MLWLLVVGGGAILCFGFVVIFGPPFVPTMQRQTESALDLLDLRKRQTLLELGSGDGRVALAAAKRGLYVVGIELNPLLVIMSKIVTWRYRSQVRIIWGDYFKIVWPRADGIFTFMLQRQMAKLDRRVVQWHTKPTRMASFAFTVPNKKPIAQRDGVFLYEYK